MDPVGDRSRRRELFAVGVQRGARDHQVRDRVEPVEPGHVERGDRRQVRVQHVEHERRDEGAHQEERGDTAPSGREREPRRRRDQQHVAEGIRAPHHRGQRVVRSGGRRHHEELPHRDRRGGPEDRAVEHAVADVTSGAQARHLVEAERDERVAHEVEHVGERHVGSNEVRDRVAVPHEIARDPRGETEADEHPRPPAPTAAPMEPDPQCRDGGGRYAVFDEVNPGVGLREVQREEAQNARADPQQRPRPVSAHFLVIDAVAGRVDPSSDAGEAQRFLIVPRKQCR